MGDDDQLRSAAFVLSQRDLIATIERLDLDPFRLFQVSLAELSATTDLDFSALVATDVIANPELRTPLPELAEAEAIAPEVPPSREVRGARDLML